jgi:hypothetical protein
VRRLTGARVDNYLLPSAAPEGRKGEDYGLYQKGRPWYIEYYFKEVRKRKRSGLGKQVLELVLVQIVMGTKIGI